MNGLVFHIASGHSFFTGVALLILAAIASNSSRPTWNRLGVLAIIVGGIAVAVSSTPLPYWLYGVATTVTLAGIAVRPKKSWRRWASYATVSIWLLAVSVELPHHFPPPLASSQSRSLTILGDSVTAGIGGGETSETWPSILGREHELEIQDLSHVGETAASALKRVESIPIIGSLVVIEIGGNDILGSTTCAQFESDLDALLSSVVASNRQIVMFELPLPPFFHEYGRIQRSLAAKYGIKLVPKRVFLSVLAGDGTTLDTIHLSQSGHRAMADCVWRIIRPAFAPDWAETVRVDSRWNLLAT